MPRWKVLLLAAGLGALGSAGARAADPWAEVEARSSQASDPVVRAGSDAAELARQGRWEEAIEEGEVASLRGDDPGARLDLALALLAVGRSLDALARAREAVVLARAAARAERGPALLLTFSLYSAASAAYRSGEPDTAWAFLDEAILLDPHGERLRAWAAGAADVVLPPGDGLFLEALRAARAGAWQEATAALTAWRRTCPSSPHERAATALGRLIAARTRPTSPSPPTAPGARAVLSGLVTLRAAGMTAPRLDAAMRPLRPALQICAAAVAAQDVEALRAQDEHLEVELVVDAAGRLRSLAPLIVPSEPAHASPPSPEQVWQDLAACWREALSRDRLLEPAPPSGPPRRARLRAAWR